MIFFPQPLLLLLLPLSFLITHICKFCFSFSSGVKYGWPKELKWIVTDPYLLSCTPQPQHQQQQQQHDSSASALCDIAFLQYTSGSTSDPKGVMITHDNLTDNLQLILSGLEATEDTVVVSWLPQYHDMGLIGSYLGALYCGGCGYYLSPISFIRNPTIWVQAMSKYKATHAQAPNFAYALTARKYLAQSRLKQMKKSGSQELNLSSLRHMINAGAVTVTERVLYYYSACVCACVCVCVCLSILSHHPILVTCLTAEPVEAASIDLFYAVFSPHGLKSGVIYPTYGLAEHTGQYLRYVIALYYTAFCCMLMCCAVSLLCSVVPYFSFTQP